MPSLPKRPYKPRNLQARKPSGDVSFYNNKWGNVSRLYRIANPLCEMCLAKGKATDASPGDRKGVTDHVVRIAAGGAKMDALNFMTLCKECHDHKSRMEKLGWTCDKVGTYGNFIPASKEDAIKSLIE